MTQVVTVRPLRVLALVDEANVVGAALVQQAGGLGRDAKVHRV